MNRPGKSFNVFSGQNGILDFLNPDQHPPLPLVELSPALNPFSHKGVRVFAKMMNFLPLGNVKSLPAYSMLSDARSAGELKGVQNLIENSSGNTVFSLAVLGRAWGIPRTQAIVSHEVSPGKLQLLRFLGTEVLVNKEPICPDPADRTSGIYKAKAIGKKKGWFNPGQYDNEANPRAHAKWTGPQVWTQTHGELTVFCCGLGTTGTMAGAGAYFKKRSKAIANIGVVRKPNNPVPGVRTQSLLSEVAFEWRACVDSVEEIGTKESFSKSLELCRAGLMAGPSSGFALAGLYSFLQKKHQANDLDSLRNKKGEIVAVFICPDSPLPYIQDYFEYLDDSDFPSVHNKEFLVKKSDAIIKEKEVHQRGLEIESADAYGKMYAVEPEHAWDLLRRGEQVPLQKGVRIVDIRSRGEFLHFHLPGAERMDMSAAAAALSLKKRKDAKVFLVCPRGARTKVIAQFLRKKKVQAYSIRGGLIEWSEKNLPRWRPEICQVPQKTV